MITKKLTIGLFIPLTMLFTPSYALQTNQIKNINDIDDNTQVIVMIRHGEKPGGGHFDKQDNKFLNKLGFLHGILDTYYLKNILPIQMKHWASRLAHSKDAYEQGNYFNAKWILAASNKVGQPDVFFAPNTQSKTKKYKINSAISPTKNGRAFQTLLPIAIENYSNINTYFRRMEIPVTFYNADRNIDKESCYNQNAYHSQVFIPSTTKFACPSLIPIINSEISNDNQLYLKQLKQQSMYNPLAFIEYNKEFHNKTILFSWEHHEIGNMAEWLINNSTLSDIPSEGYNLEGVKNFQNTLYKSKAGELIKRAHIFNNYASDSQSDGWADQDFESVYVFVLHWKESNDNDDNPKPQIAFLHTQERLPKIQYINKMGTKFINHSPNDIILNNLTTPLRPSIPLTEEQKKILTIYFSKNSPCSLKINHLPHYDYPYGVDMNNYKFGTKVIFQNSVYNKNIPNSGSENSAIYECVGGDLCQNPRNVPTESNSNIWKLIVNMNRSYIEQMVKFNKTGSFFYSSCRLDDKTAERGATDENKYPLNIKPKIYSDQEIIDKYHQDNSKEKLNKFFDNYVMRFLDKDKQYQYARQELAIIKNSIQTPELQNEPNLNDGLVKSKGSVASFSHAQKYNP